MANAFFPVPIKASGHRRMDGHSEASLSLLIWQEPPKLYPAIPAARRRPIRVLSLFDGIATGESEAMKEASRRAEGVSPVTVVDRRLAGKPLSLGSFLVFPVCVHAGISQHAQHSWSAVAHAGCLLPFSKDILLSSLHFNLDS